MSVTGWFRERWPRRKPRPATSPQPLPGAWWSWLLAGIALALAVAAITGIISYKHGLDVAHTTGNTGLVADLIPLVPDLTIAMSSLVLVVASAIGRGRPPAAIAALVVGIGWTVAQNVAGGWHGGVGGAVLAGGVPVAFVLTVELLLWLVRNVRRTPAAAPVPVAEPQVSTLPSPVPSDAESAALALLRATTTAGYPVPRNQLMVRFGLTRPQADKVIAALAPAPSMNGASHDA